MSQSSWSTEAEDQEIPTGERNTNTVCKCIQSKTHTHTPTHTHTQTHTLTYASTSSIIRTHTLTYASASSLTHPHTHTHLCKCRHTLEQNTNIHLPGQYLYVRSSLSHTHTHTWLQTIQMFMQNVYFHQFLVFPDSQCLMQSLTLQQVLHFALPPHLLFSQFLSLWLDDWW